MCRRLPPLPNKPSSLKLGQWRQSSLPEEHNPPGFHHPVPPLQGRKYMSCSQSQELSQDLTWLLIGCTKDNIQSKAIFVD